LIPDPAGGAFLDAGATRQTGSAAGY
jgi:hypothetical protein